MFGYRKQREVSNSDSNKSEKPFDRSVTAFRGSQGAAWVSPTVSDTDSDSDSALTSRSAFCKETRRFSARPELAYTMWSPHTERLENALKSNKAKLRGMRNRLRAVEEELDRCWIEAYEALVSGQDWHDDSESDGSGYQDTFPIGLRASSSP